MCGYGSYNSNAYMHHTVKILQCTEKQSMNALLSHLVLTVSITIYLV